MKKTLKTILAVVLATALLAVPTLTALQADDTYDVTITPFQNDPGPGHIPNPTSTPPTTAPPTTRPPTTTAPPSSGGCRCGWIGWGVGCWTGFDRACAPNRADCRC